MRISDRYIGLSVLSGTLFAIVLLSAVLVMGNLFKEIRPLLVEVGAPISILWSFILSVLPMSLIYTIPWAFLSSVLLVFGRLSSENELNAFRAAGIGLPRLAMPVILVGAGLSAFCIWLNVDIAPEAKYRVRNIVTETIIQDPRALLRSGVDQTRIKNVKIDTQASEGDVFHNFHIFVMDDEEQTGFGGAYIHADTAETVVDHEKKQIRLRLTGAYSDGSTGPDDEFIMQSEELEWMVVDYSDPHRRRPKASSMTNRQIETFLAENPEMTEDSRLGYQTEIQLRYSSSFACLAFAFIGVPLGIKARRRDTSSGLVLSLAVGALYFFAGSVLEDSAQRHHWALWMPNAACLGLGMWLFRRARFR
jgi:lipopolysaccharide export system permease protein